MKPILTILLILVALTIEAQKQPKPISLTITHIEKLDSTTEVYARRGYELWVANCRSFPDSLKFGMKIQALPIKKENSCDCVFKRVK